MRIVIALALMGLVSACAQPTIWDKPGATQADFNRDNYNCQKDAIATGGTIYYGYGITGRNPDANMYRQCMVAAGYTPQGREQTQALQGNASQAKAEQEAIKKDQEAVCADPRFAPYYSKTGCVVGQISFEQLADTSRASPAVRAILPELRNAVDNSNGRQLDVQRKYAGVVGAKRADLFLSTAKVQNDSNNLDLYEGKITWGEYNKRRQKIYADYKEAESKITQ